MRGMCVCDIKALSSHHNGVFDRREKEGLCLVTPHSVVNARHSCHSSLYALRQATGLSGIPLLSVCPRTALSLCIGSVCVSEAKEFAKHTRKNPKENANEARRRRGPLFDRISAHKRITLIGGGVEKKEGWKRIKKGRSWLRFDRKRETIRHVIKRREWKNLTVPANVSTKWTCRPNKAETRCAFWLTFTKGEHENP